MLKVLIVIWSVCFAALSGLSVPPEPEAIRLLPLYFVTEMEPIPELDDGLYVLPDQYPQEAQRATQEWQKHMLGIQRRLSPEKVLGMSRWALTQMQTYTTVPTLASLTLQPVVLQEARHNLIFETVVDTLPSHSPLVTRWLKLYLVYNMDSHTLLSVFVTIRGQVEE